MTHFVARADELRLVLVGSGFLGVGLLVVSLLYGRGAGSELSGAALAFVVAGGLM